MTDRFEYKGPVDLTSSTGHTVTLDNVRMWTEWHGSCRWPLACDAPTSLSCATGECDGLYEWRGAARVPGTSYRLLDVLGERCTLRLPDGRTGKAYVTGEAVDSVWIIEIQGIGTPPE